MVDSPISTVDIRELLRSFYFLLANGEDAKLRKVFLSADGHDGYIAQRLAEYAAAGSVFPGTTNNTDIDELIRSASTEAGQGRSTRLIALPVLMQAGQPLSGEAVDGRTQGLWGDLQDFLNDYGWQLDLKPYTLNELANVPMSGIFNATHLAPDQATQYLQQHAAAPRELGKATLHLRFLVAAGGERANPALDRELLAGALTVSRFLAEGRLDGGTIDSFMSHDAPANLYRCLISGMLEYQARRLGELLRSSVDEQIHLSFDDCGTAVRIARFSINNGTAVRGYQLPSCPKEPRMVFGMRVFNAFRMFDKKVLCVGDGTADFFLPI